MRLVAGFVHTQRKSIIVISTSSTTFIFYLLIHISIDSCNNVLAEGLTIRAPGDNPNTDGIHISFANVKLRNINVGTGDDCIGVLKGTSNLAIEHVTCKPGHGISVGSLDKYPFLNGVTNVTVNGASFTSTQNGVRIKTWQGGKGFAKGLTFENIRMSNVGNPIIIDQYYCPGCTAQEFDMNVNISNVVFKNIMGTLATKEVINLACSKSFPCQDIKVENVNLSYGNNEAQSFCKNVKGIGENFGENYVKPPLVC